MLDTYTNLQAAIKAALMRDDLDTFIPDWITLAEASIRRLLKSQNDVVRAYVSGGGADERYENLPGDFYELVAPPRLNAPEGSVPLDYLTPLVMDDLWRSPETGGRPRYFTIVGAQIEFYPQPAGEQIEIAYKQGVIALATATGGVNPLLLEAPDIYLYGALLHSAPWIREDERLAVWEHLYTAALADFNAAHLRKRYSGGPLRMRPRRAIG